METEELTKLVDGIYKNILDKFNPGARQMINAGKAYLKALHGAAAASRLYVEAITKLARQAQQGTWGGSSDIGSALMQVVEVYKEIQSQQMNILKAFYVDLLVPLETNLEKDTKVVQSEQKKFLQQHKARSETYSKAAANMKKQRKKGSKSGSKTGLAMDKELKNMQILEEEKSKLDIFCEQSLKNAMTQERRRYGFVLERQCSLAKHYLAYHTAGVTSYNRHLDEWQDIARSREYLPESVKNMFTTKLRQVSFWQDDDNYNTRGNMDEDRISVASQLRKTKSMDASCLDVRSINDVTSPLKPLSRAKSEYNLNSSTHSLVQEDPSSPQRPKSMAIPDKPSWESPLARALYAYLSSGDNQLSFLEGDIIALLGERNKGWQFGENLRTQCSGWFPLAYTELITDDSSVCSPTHRRMDSVSTNATTPGTPGLNSTSNSNSGKPSPTTMFGDTLLHRRVVKQIPLKAMPITSANLGPPPSQPAPIPELSQHNGPRSITTTAIVHPPQPLLSPRGDAATLPGKRGTIHPPPMPPLPLHLGGKRANGAPGSLHSSNDSGFSNDPPPQPEVDYSDDDSARIQRRKRNGTNGPEKKELMSSVRGWLLYKSALDLWDDVNEQNPNKQHQPVSRTLSARQIGDGTGTLGRFDSQDLMKATPIAVDKIPEIPNKITVKRTKSLWKFKKSNKNEILEGMSLWKHRSLIDVCSASTDKEEEINKKDNHDEEEDDKTENIYASAENIQNEKQKYIEKINNEKNSRNNEEKMNDNSNGRNYYEEENRNEDGSESVIVVNDHINVRKNRYKFDVSYNGKLERSNSHSDLSDNTETGTLQKDNNFLPRTKLMKSNSNDLTTQYIIRDAKQKEYQTWNPNYRLKESRKWQNDDDNNLFKEKSNNKLKDAPKLFKDQLQLTDNKTKCGPWYDLWGIDSSVKT